MEADARHPLATLAKPTLMYHTFNYTLHNSETQAVSQTSLIVIDLGLRELFFFAFVVFFLQMYLALIRRAWPLPSERDLDDDIEAGELYGRDADLHTPLSAFREIRTPNSGLTIQEIDRQLASFSADGVRNHGCARRFSGGHGGDCIVQFGQEVCAICLDDWGCRDGAEKLRHGAEKLRRLPCDHVFHQGKLSLSRYISLLLCVLFG